jgi:dTDP-4-amino-4,6-dideoxygalactose transaminase
VNVPFLDVAAQYLELRAETDATVACVLQRGEYVGGSENAAFERELAAYLNVREVVGVNSGTDALLLTLKALGIGARDEVIVPAYTFFATAEAVCLAGARPSFADCGVDSFNADLHSIERAWTPNVRAVIVVHLFGQPVDLGPIDEFCRARGLHLIEDAAQAIGASYRGRRVGSLARAAAFSFYPTKNLGACGDGGAVCCDDADLAARLRQLRNHGRSEAYRHAEIGINSRLDEIQAAILRVKLPQLDRWNERRRAIAARYGAGLRDTRCELLMHAGRDGDVCVFHQFALLHPEREALRLFLAREGVESAVYYPVPCHQQAAFSSMPDQSSLPHAERYSRHALSLPMHTGLADSAVDFVIELVREFERR